MSMNSIAPVRSSRSIISESERDQPVAYLSMHSIWVWLSPNALNSFSLCVCTNTFKRSLALYHEIRCQFERKNKKVFPSQLFFSIFFGSLVDSFVYALTVSLMSFSASQFKELHHNNRNRFTCTEQGYKAIEKDEEEEKHTRNSDVDFLTPFLYLDTYNRMLCAQ